MRREPSPPLPRPATAGAPAAPAPAAAAGARFAPERGPDPALVAGWVEAASQGDSAAFAALVHAYGALVTRVIGRLVSDPDDRDDLVQETFVRAFTALGKFKRGEPFRPWLLTIALNLARDAWRRRKVRPSPVPLVDEAGTVLPIPSPDPSPESVAAGEELRRRAESAFGRLERDHQAILWLRVREGLEYDEIATVLAIPRGTVMSRLARARAALRRELDDERDRGRAGEDYR